MRHVSDYLTAALAQGAAKLCHVWLLTRGDAAVLGFTDHDRPLLFEGVLCAAQSGLTQGAADGDLGQASSAAVSGVLSSTAITAADVEAGLYDGAEVAEYMVDWTNPAEFVHLCTGHLAQLEARGGVADGGAFVAHVEGPLARLDRVIGRRFGFLCDAALGDARCRLDPMSVAGQSCDKRYATCLDTFHNRQNFRGFPDLPGEDFLTVYPRGGDVMDGTSRAQGSGR